MEPEKDNGNVLQYRVGVVETDVREMLGWRRGVDTDRASMREQIKTNTETLARVGDGLEALKRTLIGFAVTVAGAALIFAFSILASSGKI